MALDSDLLEEKKKAELRHRFISLYVAEIIRAEEAAKFKAWQHSLDKFFDKAKADPAQKIKDDIEFAYSCYAAAELSKERRKELFGLHVNDPDYEKLQGSLHKLNLEKDDFSVVALAACKDGIKKAINFLGKPFNTLTKEEADDFDRIRDEAVIEAKEAVFAYEHDRPEIFAKLLGGGLRIACENFATEPDRKLAAQWSIHIEDMLRVVKTNPMLQKLSGLTEDQIAIAENIAGRGHALREGLKSLEQRSKLSAAELRKLPEKEEAKFVGNLIKMEISLEARNQLTKDWDIIEMDDLQEVLQKEGPVLSAK